MRPGENGQEPTMWRIFFSIAHFPIAATGLFFFRLTKLRRTFYVQVECLCFHTGWPQTCPPVDGGLNPRESGADQKVGIKLAGLADPANSPVLSEPCAIPIGPPQQGWRMPAVLAWLPCRR